MPAEREISGPESQGPQKSNLLAQPRAPGGLGVRKRVQGQIYEGMQKYSVAISLLSASYSLNVTTSSLIASRAS